MIVDAFAHFLPPKYFSAVLKKAKPGSISERTTANAANTDINVRRRVMDRHPEIVQVLTISQPALEAVVSPDAAVELARIGNDEVAELLVKYPDKFIAGVACLPLNNIDASLKEIERTVTELKFRGIQLYSNINNEPLGSAKFKPLYEMMVKYDLPIWIHPWMGKTGDEAVFGWPYETSSAMLNLVSSRIFQNYPQLKFVIHHAGAMVPFFEQRINWLFPLAFASSKIPDPVKDFQKFYVDTAIYGSTPALMCSYDFFGIDHMLFGADMPLGPLFGLTVQTIDSINRMNISQSDKNKIFSQNAVKLLRMAI
jgi:predicted TIM-barrel fold metal-dependent hydrolase